MIISQSTKEKAESIKAYIQGRYKKLNRDEKEKKEGKVIEQLAWKKIKIKMAEANLSKAEQELVKKEILHREAIISREGY